MKALLLIAFAFASAATLPGAERLPPNQTRDAMRFKLFHAQGVLEGLSTDNFPLIATNAVRLKQLSQSVDWRVRSTPEYQRLTADFVRATEALEKAARNRNSDAATLAYFQLTVSCVTCHKHLRGAEVAKHSITP